MGHFEQQTTWGWLIAAYLFLGGLGGAVGAIGIGIDLFIQPRRRLGIFAALSGFAFLMLGTILLLVDLMQPLKAVFFFMNPRSWIFWGILAISGFMVTSIQGLAVGEVRRAVSLFPRSLAALDWLGQRSAGLRRDSLHRVSHLCGAGHHLLAHRRPAGALHLLGLLHRLRVSDAGHVDFAPYRGTADRGPRAGRCRPDHW